VELLAGWHKANKMPGNSEIRDSNGFDDMNRFASCRFPAFGTGRNSPERQMSIGMGLGHLQELQGSPDGNLESILSILRAAWALTLRYYTQSDRICFGWQEIDVDLTMDNIARQHEMPSNTVASSITIEDATILREVVEGATSKFVTPGDYRGAETLTIPEYSSFNTVMVLQKHPGSVEKHTAISPTHPLVNVALPKEVSDSSSPGINSCYIPVDTLDSAGSAFY
jgi:hypothetical protein